MEQRSEQDTFMELLEPVYNRLERFVLAMTRNRDVAKDIIHETVAIAWQQFGSLRQRKAFLSYLFTIATRTHAQHVRQQRRSIIADDDFWEYMSSHETSPETVADYRALYEAIDKLPEQQREAVIMFELLGFSMKEVQQVQGGTLISVKVRVSRARKKLAQLLGATHTEKRALKNALRPDSVVV